MLCVEVAFDHLMWLTVAPCILCFCPTLWHSLWAHSKVSDFWAATAKVSVAASNASSDSPSLIFQTPMTKMSRSMVSSNAPKSQSFANHHSWQENSVIISLCACCTSKKSFHLSSTEDPPQKYVSSCVIAFMKLFWGVFAGVSRPSKVSLPL